MTKPEAHRSVAAIQPLPCTALDSRSASPPFAIRTSGFIRHSPFVIRHFLPSIAVLLLARSDLLACAVCYGQSDSPLAEGMNMGILFLLGVVALVLGGFVAFFIYLARRSAAVAASRQAASNSISSS